jgi:hypothetical protein
MHDILLHLSKIRVDKQCLEKELRALFFEDTFTAKKNYPAISLSPLIGWKKLKRAARFSKTG